MFGNISVCLSVRFICLAHLALAIKYSSSPDASGNVIYSCIYIQIISEAPILNVWLNIFSDELTIRLRGSNPL